MLCMKRVFWKWGRGVVADNVSGLGCWEHLVCCAGTDYMLSKCRPAANEFASSTDGERAT